MMEILSTFLLLIAYIAVRIASWRLADADGRSPLWVRDLLDFTPKDSPPIQTPPQRAWTPRLIMTAQPVANDERKQTIK